MGRHETVIGSDTPRDHPTHPGVAMTINNRCGDCGEDLSTCGCEGAR